MLQYMVVKKNFFRLCLSSGVDLLDEVLDISNSETRGPSSNFLKGVIFRRCLSSGVDLLDDIMSNK
jgi:hypothetical protein